MNIYNLNFIEIIIKETMNGTATYPSTCQEYFDRGTRKNGTYKIRPSLELHSFRVLCEFTEDSGLTIVRPQDWNETGYVYPENENERCRSADCYTKTLEYGVSKEQIKVFKN